MGDVRINVKPAKSANAESLLLMVDNQIIDLSGAEAETRLTPGEHTVSAILTRKQGETGPVRCELAFHNEAGELIEAVNVEVADWGDINQTRKTIRFA